LAHAQADVKPPPPNILLLVDTSGSMDYKTGSSSFPTCKYAGAGDTGLTSERSRWIDLVEVLTGSISKYQCQRLDRNSSSFRTEYASGAAEPYDFLYANPYHRPVSDTCVAGPGTLGADPKLFPAGAIKYHPVDNTGATCTFNQASDGILDAFSEDVRFGLMTFDTEPRPDTGRSGLWSYFSGSSRQGEPAGCLVPQDQEVGVRNAEAPPWEGRAVGFGNPSLGSTEFTSRNAMIQEVLLATRPYGATPIAGMLDDARTYFTLDTSDDPLNSSFRFGPLNEPASACRHQAIILLSDGQPNMDLRPFCEPGGCPYQKPEQIAQELKSKGIETYVIGFALAAVDVDGTPTACSDFTADDFNEQKTTGICYKHPNDQAIQACCSLNRIAAAGGHTPTPGVVDDADWSRARFANNRDELRSALSQAIGGSFTSTTRTPFVPATGSGFVSQTSDLDFARSFRFSASFTPGKLDKPWVGELNRGRYKCVDDNGVLKPTLVPPNAAEGDKFVDNVNSDGPGARRIYTVIGANPIASDHSIRPNLASGVVDGVGTYSGTMNATAMTSLDFATGTPPAAVGLSDTTKACTDLNKDAANCRDHYLKWLVGLDNGTKFNRCPSYTTGNCSLISEIYHSIPRAVPGRPSEFLLDQSYQRFVDGQVEAKRPSVLYASSNDGFLHAFKILQVDKEDQAETMQVKTKESNELWTFVPPGVLPGIPGLYPAARQHLLDGTPAIKEVVATAFPAGTSYKFKLERSLNQARGGLGEWRTILVQSFGRQHPGYFAIDVTDPTAGPKFLWQLATDSAGEQIFGEGGGTPLITTVYLDHEEVAVAILPGGYAKTAGTAGGAGTGCARGKTDWPVTPKPRTNIPCYAGKSLLARSLTVVRLDSGEILRTFRQSASEVPGLAAAVVTEAFIDSPMTGQPVAYPNDVGGVADRVFIGDQDGGLWRLNFASAAGDPDDWTLELFFDGFPNDGTEFSHTWAHGQPIISAPIVSVDRTGNLTIAFSTGEQEAIGDDPSKPANYVWSLTEKPSADRTTLTPQKNWYLALTGAFSGDRVIGEMALFAGDLFFSTVGPGSSNDSCSSGSGKVWGMHYIDSASGNGKGGKTSTTLTGLVNTDGYVDATTLLGSDAHAFLSGVSVAQQPTCDSPGTAADNGYFAYGVKPTGGAVTPGKYQLIIPTGDRKTTSTKPGISAIDLGGGNGAAIDLKKPATPLIVDSWASIVE
jgi:type IV pilus assembly protein PilY1